MRSRSIVGLSAVVASIVMVGALHAGDAVKSGLARRNAVPGEPAADTQG